MKTPSAWDRSTDGALGDPGPLGDGLGNRDLAAWQLLGSSSLQRVPGWLSTAEMQSVAERGIRVERVLRAAPDVAFWVLAAGLGVALALLVGGQLSYGLEYDESYLLRVVSNISTGTGFVDDGVSFGTTGLPFDPNISTGPSLLLPAAAVWTLTDGSVAAVRLVPLLYFAVLLAATAWLLRRYGGRWAALAAVAGYLLIPQVHPDLQNGSLMPGRVVGELPAAALLVLAAALIAGRHPGLAGLAAGLAVEAKLVFAIPAATLLVISAMWTWRSDRQIFAATVTRFMIGAAIPVLAFEIYKLTALGTDGYTTHVSDTRAFGRSQSLPFEALPSVLPLKWEALQSLISPLMIIVVVLFTIATIWTRSRTVRNGAAPAVTPWPCSAAITSLTVGFALIIAWWLLRSWQLSPRPVLPAIAVMTSLLCGLTVTRARRLAHEDRTLGPSHLLLVSCWIALAVGVTASTVGTLTNHAGATLQRDQLAAARVLMDRTDVTATDGFWTNPELQLLSGLPPAPSDPSSVIAYTSVRALAEKGTPDARLYLDRCAAVLFASRNVVVCARR